MLFVVCVSVLVSLFLFFWDPYKPELNTLGICTLPFPPPPLPNTKKQTNPTPPPPTTITHTHQHPGETYSLRLQSFKPFKALTVKLVAADGTCVYLYIHTL